MSWNPVHVILEVFSVHKDELNIVLQQKKTRMRTAKKYQKFKMQRKDEL